MLEQEKLDARVLRQQPRGNDLRVVQHKQVVRGEKFGELAELVVAERLRSPIHDQHPRGIPLGRGARGDELPGQLEIVIGQQAAHDLAGNVTRARPALWAAALTRSAKRRLSRRPRAHRNAPNPM